MAAGNFCAVRLCIVVGVIIFKQYILHQWMFFTMEWGIAILESF